MARFVSCVTLLVAGAWFGSVTAAVWRHGDNNDNINEVLPEDVGCTVDGVNYRPGEKMEMGGDCEQCQCVGDGVTYCHYVQCEVPTCIDAEIPQGECCPICPFGTNCWLKDEILWGRHHAVIRVTQSCSKTCICPPTSVYSKYGAMTTAQCFDPCH